MCVQGIGEGLTQRVSRVARNRQRIQSLVVSRFPLLSPLVHMSFPVIRPTRKACVLHVHACQMMSVALHTLLRVLASCLRRQTMVGAGGDSSGFVLRRYNGLSGACRSVSRLNECSPGVA